MEWPKVSYVLGGLLKRLYRQRECPGCGSGRSQPVERKGFHLLLRCEACGLLYRWPYETPAEMAKFYQRAYQQAGLTTDLPDPASLEALMASGFKGSSKDFSRVLNLLSLLGISPGARVLDFGANWGYGVWQFKEAGFDAVGYELSRPRAEYSARLGVEVFSDWQEAIQRGPFDVVFSSHVLEHTPNPAAALREQSGVLAEGGILVAYVPNGAEAFRHADPESFHKLWGHVHPVMLNERFLRHALPSKVVAVGAHTDADLRELANWDGKTDWTGTLDTGEILMVAVGKAASIDSRENNR